MSFKDLERLVSDFFNRNTQAVSADSLTKEATKHFVLKAFEEEHKAFIPWWTLWRKSAQVGMAFCLMLFGAFVHRLIPASYAGELQNTAGMVEVIRNNQVLTVSKTKPFNLKVGDLVQVEPLSQATIATKNGISTQMQGGTTLKIADKTNLFVQEGSITASLNSGNTISTHRGFISAPTKGTFHMEILPTGEARVVLEDNAIEVSDWMDNKAQLFVTGEELRLKTDTKLSNKRVPGDLKISDSQLQIIESKLVIARSKLFTGLEKSLIRRNSGRSDIESAQKTFRSILQILLNTDRHLNVYGNFDLDLVDDEVVIEAIKTRTSEQKLIIEAKAFTTLLSIVEHKTIDIEAGKSNESTFNRYALTHYLQSLANEEDKILLEHVKNQYVNTSLRKIINHEERSRQVSALEELLENISVMHPLWNSFFDKLNNQMDPVLQKHLEKFSSRIRY
jgi:hypothetical protein